MKNLNVKFTQDNEEMHVFLLSDEYDDYEEEYQEDLDETTDEFVDEYDENVDEISEDIEEDQDEFTTEVTDSINQGITGGLMVGVFSIVVFALVGILSIVLIIKACQRKSFMLFANGQLIATTRKRKHAYQMKTQYEQMYHIPVQIMEA